MAELLPAELWSYIFDLAADEDIIFYPGLPTSMTPSSWCKSIVAGWRVRTSQDTLKATQRGSYATKKSIISTCKRWRQLGLEFLVRCLFFDNPIKLRDLRNILDRDTSLGWWVCRLHITDFSDGRGPTMDDFEEPLLAILKQCSNLEIFIIDWPMSAAFGAIADTLAQYCKKLRTVQWHVPYELLPKVIWALDTLRGLVSVHLHFDEALHETEAITLGSAESVKLTLPYLQQLFVKGSCQAFVEQATGWNLPMLLSFSFDFGPNRHDMPDIVAFLAQHGPTLLFLDLKSVPALDVRSILDLCPLLTTFCFNLDWKIDPSTEQPMLPPPITVTSPDGADVIHQLPPAVLTNRPHLHLRHIGLHGCDYAFGVGYASVYPEFTSAVIQHTNDTNMRALVSRESFPHLERVRVLSPVLLQDLNDAGCPQQGECFKRWERWWDLCVSQGVRLEDCSGAPLGTLPRDPGDEGDEYDDEDEYEEEGEEDEYDTEEEEENKRQHKVCNLAELRELIQECQRMSEEGRQEPPFLFPY